MDIHTYNSGNRDMMSVYASCLHIEGRATSLMSLHILFPVWNAFPSLGHSQFSL